MISLSHVYGAEIIKALGLPKYTKEAEVRFAVDEVVTITCKYLPDDATVRRGVQMLTSTYQLWPNKAEWMKSRPFNADGTRSFE